MDLKINVTKKFVINGKEYHSLEEMPADIRKLYEAAIAHKGASASMSAESGISRKISVNDRYYSSPDEMPPETRELYEKALAMAQRGGRPEISSSQTSISASIGPLEPTTSGKKGRALLIAAAFIFLLYCAYRIFTKS